MDNFDLKKYLIENKLNTSGVNESSFDFNDEELKRMMTDLVDYTRSMISAVPKSVESKKFVDNFISEYKDYYKKK